MTPMDPLGDTLCALAEKLQPAGIELIIGGGYGLVLRAGLLAADARTGRYGFPITARATSDIDCFLSTHIIIDGAKTQRIAIALEELGFTARESYFIFERTVDIRGRRETLQVDLLASDVSPEYDDLVYRKGDRRIRPKTYGNLHARLTPAAATVEHGCTRTDISPDGRGVFVVVPHPVSFIVMKLFAFRDRFESMNPDMQGDAPYHAFDVFVVLASVDAAEWDQGRAILNAPGVNTIITEARGIIQQYFKDVYAIGVVRLVEYASGTQGLRIREDQAQSFVSDLTDLFALADTTVP